MILFLLASSAEEVANQSVDPSLLMFVYLLSSSFFLAGLVLTILTLRVRKGVKRKHLASMAILEDWNNAIKAAYSGKEEDILIGLDKIWALSNPVSYSEIQPVVALFLGHANKNISTRAQQILEKQLALLAEGTPMLNNTPAPQDSES
jgi:hypothetical protein